MKYLFLFLLLLLISCNKAGNVYSEDNTDKDVAISAVEKVWKSVYGKSQINSQKPFVAEQKNDSIWIVHGTLSKPTIGGVAYARVNVKTKKVTEYSHGE